MYRKFQDSPNVNWFKTKTKKEKNFPSVIKTFMGRDAINLLLFNIKKESKKALLPAYTCTEVTDQFQKHGYEIVYYDLNFFEIEELPQTTDIDIFYFIRYFGMEAKNIKSAIKKVKRENPNISIIEDRAHYLSDKPLFKDVDAYIFSFRKLLPIPEGGGLLTDMKIDYNYKSKFISNFLAIAMVLKKRFIGHNPKFSRSKIASENSLSNAIFAPSFLSNRVIENFDIDENIKLRRELFYLWLEKSKKHSIKPLFSKLQEDDIPQGFPIIVSDAKEVFVKMQKEEIYLKRHWVFDEKFKTIAPKSYKLSNEIITLPIYEGINEEDMDMIIDKILELRA